MDALHHTDWKHCTLSRYPAGRPISVVLFNDEFEEQDSIYYGYPCGGLWPCRSVNRQDPEHHERVISAWCSKDLVVVDNRK